MSTADVVQEIEKQGVPVSYLSSELYTTNVDCVYADGTKYLLIINAPAHTVVEGMYILDGQARIVKHWTLTDDVDVASVVNECKGWVADAHKEAGRSC